MKRSFAGICCLSGILLLAACGSGSEPKNTGKEQAPVKDSAAAPQSAQSTTLKVTDRSADDVARFLAGLSQKQGSTLMAYEQMEPWKLYHKRADSIWKKLNGDKLARMRKLSDADLKSINEKEPHLFYPFSGPDFLNAFTFFPKAKSMVLIGLENPGSVPSLELFAADSFRNMIGQIDRSLNTVIRFSFFRTISMAKDLKSRQLDGTLPLAMIFVVRTGNSIVDVEQVFVDSLGTLQSGTSKLRTATNGYKIRYNREDGGHGEMIYFGTDLSDVALPKNKGFLTYLRSMETGYTTYLKAASFLMHKDYFSTIRSLILKNSAYVLQDDSGIPVRYFVKGGWNIKLYGTYDKPISLFANWYQPDLKQLYDSLGAQPLDFGIGYDWKQNESNLMYFVKP